MDIKKFNRSEYTPRSADKARVRLSEITKKGERPDMKKKIAKAKEVIKGDR